MSIMQRTGFLVLPGLGVVVPGKGDDVAAESSSDSRMTDESGLGNEYDLFATVYQSTSKGNEARTIRVKTTVTATSELEEPCVPVPC